MVTVKLFSAIKVQGYLKDTWNITQYRLSKLCPMGLSIISNNEKYSNITQEFIERYSTA